MARFRVGSFALAVHGQSGQQEVRNPARLPLHRRINQTHHSVFAVRRNFGKQTERPARLTGGLRRLRARHVVVAVHALDGGISLQRGAGRVGALVIIEAQAVGVLSISAAHNFRSQLFRESFNAFAGLERHDQFIADATGGIGPGQFRHGLHGARGLIAGIAEDEEFGSTVRLRHERVIVITEQPAQRFTRRLASELRGHAIGDGGIEINFPARAGGDPLEQFRHGPRLDARLDAIPRRIPA